MVTSRENGNWLTEYVLEIRVGEIEHTTYSETSRNPQHFWSFFSKCKSNSMSSRFVGFVVSVQTDNVLYPRPELQGQYTGACSGVVEILVGSLGNLASHQRGDGTENVPVLLASTICKRIETRIDPRKMNTNSVTAHDPW